MAVYDTGTSPLINQAVAGAVGAKSSRVRAARLGRARDRRLAIATTRERRAFSTEELGPLRTLAAEAALALERARSASALEEALEQQRALLEAAQVVTSELQLETVLQRLVDEVAELLEADAADCYLLDPGAASLRCAAVHGLDAGLDRLRVSGRPRARRTRDRRGRAGRDDDYRASTADSARGVRGLRAARSSRR